MANSIVTVSWIVPLTLQNPYISHEAIMQHHIIKTISIAGANAASAQEDDSLVFSPLSFF